jgi:hypothetical protein
VGSHEVHFRGIPEENLASERLISVDESFMDRLKAVKKLNPEPSLPKIARQFLGDLVEV